VEGGTLDALQAWYAAQCDGDWEHRFGVMIASTEASGWELRVDLAGTSLEGNELARRRSARTPDDWLELWCDGFTFRGAGGADNLDELVGAFFDFAGRVESFAP
jgi:immunity protein 53 of polymorphic toxin system